MTGPRDSLPPFDVYHFIALVAGSAALGGLAAWAAGELSAWKLVAMLGVSVVLLWGAGVIAIRRHSGGVGSPGGDS